jgi:hypothetical protein
MCSPSPLTLIIHLLFWDWIAINLLCLTSPKWRFIKNYENLFPLCL